MNTLWNFLFSRMKYMNNEYFGDELSEKELNQIQDQFVFSDEFKHYFEGKMKEKIHKTIKEKERRYLDRVYAANEAARIWGISASNLRNAVNRFGRFDKWIELGEVRKSDATWIFTERAMRDVFGEPINEWNEEVE